MSYRHMAIPLTVLLLLAGCTATETVAFNDPPAASTATEPAATAEVPAETDALPEPDAEPPTAVPEAGLTGHIAVATASGEIYVIDPQGGSRVDLAGGTRPAGAQPVWSPDGRRLAWSERGSGRGAILTANADGSAQLRAETLFAGYFGYWDPTSTTLGFLGNAPPGTGLVLDDGSGASLGQVVDSDTFYYFSWSPDGTEWVVHSGSGIRIMDIDGNRKDIDLDDAFFRAPVWAPDGSILLAVTLDDRHAIVSLDPVTETIEELLEVGPVANLVLAPDGRFLAVETTTPADEGDDDDGITVAHRQLGSTSQVLVYDLATGDVTQAYDDAPGAMWWSPDGRRLLLLVAEAGQSPQFAQWLVWDVAGSFRTERFVPTRTLATSYLPFYDQYAQSVSPWAPDSSGFVYAGTPAAGEPGVFVQPAVPQHPPVRVAEDGEVAFWSPS